MYRDTALLDGALVATVGDVCRAAAAMYDIGYAAGWAAAQADRHEGAVHHLACQMLGLAPYEGDAPPWAAVAS